MSERAGDPTGRPLDVLLVFGIPGYVAPLGFVGSPVATAIAQWGQLAALVLVGLGRDVHGLP